MKNIISFFTDLKLFWQLVILLCIFGLLFLSPAHGMGFILVTLGWYMVAAGTFGLVTADILAVYYNWRTGNKPPSKKVS